LELGEGKIVGFLLSFLFLFIFTFFLLKKRGEKSQVWWYILVIPAFRRLKQENGEVEASLGYMVRLLSEICPPLQKKRENSKTTGLIRRCQRQPS
jgi:hypothetical protein